MNQLNQLNQHLEVFASAGIPKIEPPKNWTKGVELCNRTACQSARNVVYYNHSTRAYYCPKCAKIINNGNDTIDDTPLCNIDIDKLKYETEFKQDMTWEEFQNTRDLFFQ